MVLQGDYKFKVILSYRANLELAKATCGLELGMGGRQADKQTDGQIDRCHAVGSLLATIIHSETLACGI